MLGLGETHEEIIETMEDLNSVNVDILTLGQYLQPTAKHLPIHEFAKEFTKSVFWSLLWLGVVAGKRLN